MDFLADAALTEEEKPKTLTGEVFSTETFATYLRILATAANKATLDVRNGQGEAAGHCNVPW